MATLRYDCFFLMPNWFYLIVNFCYLFALAVWIGGGLGLGGIVAPALFRTLPRAEAGALFGRMLGRFARFRLAAVAVAILMATVKHLLWETHASTVWMVIRWTALVTMAAAVGYELLFLEDAIEATRGNLADGIPDDDPRRMAFMRLHKRSERLMKAALIAAAVALFLS